VLPRDDAKHVDVTAVHTGRSLLHENDLNSDDTRG